MAHIVILGAGIGGMPAAYELRAKLDKTHRITVVNAVDYFQFVPSNPWLAVGWRERDRHHFPIRPLPGEEGHRFRGAARGAHRRRRQCLELQDGSRPGLRLPGHHHRAEAGLRRGARRRPAGGHTQSICAVDHAEKALERYQEFVKTPGPAIIGAMPGASCFGPAYEFALHLQHRPEAPQAAPQGAHHISSPASPTSATWDSAAWATRSRCWKASSATTTSSGSATPR